jgi:prolyl-tRNA synthetase
MLQSKLFCKTKKEKPKEGESISYQYLVRGDFFEQTISGVYRILPLGWLVYQKIENIIREEMLNLGAQELYLPAFQNKKLWLETNRWNTIDPPLFKLRDRHNKEIALGPTHEEEIVDIVRKRVKSYKDLPLALFQIQTKFRNELRPSRGLLRTREFIMKDLYSFDRSEKEALNFYSKVKKAYFRIFKKCGLDPIAVEASSGTIGGEYSEEFMVLKEIGEDRVLICKKCNFSANFEKVGKIKKCPRCQGELIEKRAIEIGHIFYLGTKYSEAMQAIFLDKNGERKFIYMGCYGIGLQRLIATIVEIWHDEKGIIWPKLVAPFKFHLIPIEKSNKVNRAIKILETNLEKRSLEVLVDDRKNVTPGEKFADSDLIGIPLRIVVSERTLKDGSIEIKKRKEKRVKLVKLNEFLKNIEKYA